MYTVNYTDVETTGLEKAEPAILDALAGLRANEARYFATHYTQDFIVYPADEKPELKGYIEKILKDERDIVIASPMLEVADLVVENEQQFAGRARWTYGIYANGMCLNVLYSLDSPKKRALGIKLCDGMEQPAEIASFKFARQKSKLAGTIRGSFFVLKKEWN